MPRRELLLLRSLVARARTTEPRGRLTDLTRRNGTHTHHTRVDGARHAVLQLHVKLWQRVGVEHRSIAQVTLRSRLNQVADLETLDRLVLGDGARAVRATDEDRVATAALVPPSVTPLFGHPAQPNLSIDTRRPRHTPRHTPCTSVLS